MQTDIHPEYRFVVFKDISCDFEFLTRSTIDEKNFKGGLESEAGGGRIGAAGTGAGVRSVVGLDGSGAATAVQARSKL